MSGAPHHVIIGSGSAGFGAACTLREGDADCRITLITMDGLPFYHRFDLPQIFRGTHDWRDLLEVPPAHYEQNRITLRRRTRVVDVNGSAQTVELAHRESLAYDRLLVCAGGRGYLPENLAPYAEHFHGFGSFEAAMTLYRDLPAGGTAIMIGGDMIGIDLALTLLDTGYRVILIVTAQTFWPHEVAEADRAPLFAALRARGAEVIEDRRAVAVARRVNGRTSCTVTFDNGDDVSGDVVMSFCGLVSSVEFMLGADVDIERGLLVDPELRTSNPSIWAAGDVCQIWNDAHKSYEFHHGWKNVRMMGELAARNMLGAHEIFTLAAEDRIGVGDDGNIELTFWTR